MLALLMSDYLREDASLRLEGYPVQEIARRLGLSDRSINRKLDLIRKAWATKLDGTS